MHLRASIVCVDSVCYIDPELIDTSMAFGTICSWPDTCISPLRAVNDRLPTACKRRPCLVLQLLIDGEFVDSSSGKTFETEDPRTGQVLVEVAEAQEEDVDRAVQAARKVYT